MEYIACPICGNAPAITFQVETLATVPLACATCHPLPRTSRETDAGSLNPSPEYAQSLIEQVLAATKEHWTHERVVEVMNAGQPFGETIDVEFRPIKPKKRRRKAVVTLEKIDRAKITE